MKRLAIFGAGGHGQVVGDMAYSQGWSVIFYDDGIEKGVSAGAWSVAGDSAELIAQLHDIDGVVVGIGDNDTRMAKSLEFQLAGARLVSIVHPQAVVSSYAQIGDGSVVMAGAVLNHAASIGMCCIINTLASVDHDCHLEAGVHVSPGANLAGGVVVGKFSSIGVGSSVIPLINIGENVVVGAGSVVIRNIPDGQVVVGCPAKAIS